MKDLVVPIVVAAIASIGTVIATKMSNSGNKSISKLETLPDLAQQLRQLIEENRNLSSDNIGLKKQLTEIQGQMTDTQHELATFRKINSELNIKLNELLEERKSDS